MVSLTGDFTVYDLIRRLDRSCTLAASYLGLTLTVGVGAPCRELSDLARSAAEARTALDYLSLIHICAILSVTGMAWVGTKQRKH